MPIIHFPGPKKRRKKVDPAKKSIIDEIVQGIRNYDPDKDRHIIKFREDMERLGREGRKDK